MLIISSIINIKIKNNNFKILKPSYGVSQHQNKEVKNRIFKVKYMNIFLTNKKSFDF